MFVEVAVHLPGLQETFHYHLPPHLDGRVGPGHLVTVPFGPRRAQGVVLRLDERAPVPETRPVEDLVDPDPVLTAAQLRLAHWLAETYRAPLIDCLTLMLPPGLAQQADIVYRLEDPQAEGQTAAERRLLDLLRRRGPLRGRQIARALPRVDWRRAAEALRRRGALVAWSVLDPPRVRPRRVRTARLAVPPETAAERLTDLGRPGSAAARRRRAVLEALLAEREPLEVTWVYAETGASLADLRYLESRGLVALSEAEIWRDPLEALEFVPTTPPRLTADQQAVWQQIEAALQSLPQATPPPMLLYGVTGSGKTEIYLRAVAETLDRGRGALILVPEIALTAQTVRRFVARFPGQVGLLHSGLSEGERYDTWRRCRAGLLPVIVGARSALFAPMPQVGLIVVDESHDESYKEQERPPRYHAREAALAYARQVGALCLLGSATPDVVTMYRAERGEVRLLRLPRRIHSHPERLRRQAARLRLSPRYRPGDGDAQVIDLPPVRVVDMRQELKAGHRGLLSRPLQHALEETLAAGQQAILLLNRRGGATYVFCRECGWTARCPRCEMPLVEHPEEGRLRCHHCGYSRRNVERCPRCRSDRVRRFGAGTQRLEAEVRRLFPEARTLRWDRDTTGRRGAHEVLLSHFVAHRADVLIGTQMVAKGLDIPLVTLVGVVSADAGLNLPDVRAAERTFQLLTQVAGRAGRGPLGGRVILQTFHPDHYVVQAAARHDYEAFYRQELAYRKRLGYPPFRRLARLVTRHLNPDTAAARARRLAAQLRRQIARQGGEADLIGPAPCFFQRLRGEARWQVILRAADPTRYLPERLPEGWTLDLDPVSLL